VIKAESDYYPWGGELQFVNNDSNDYKFTGKKRDLETGLDYFGARYYSNGLGRWVSADWSATPVPVPYADFGDPQSLNLYGYVRNIPTSRVDKDGHCVEDLCIVEGAVALTILKYVGAAVIIGGGAVITYLHQRHQNSPPPAAATTPHSTPTVPPPPPPPGPPKNQDKLNKKRAQLKANKAQGKAFENQVVDTTKAADNNVAEQVTLKTESGLKTRMDVVSENQSGTIRLQEAKSSAPNWRRVQRISSAFLCVLCHPGPSARASL
jgi:RHS repeat-associated protein